MHSLPARMKYLWFCVTLSSAGRGVESQKGDRKAPDPTGPSCEQEGICRAGQNPVPAAHNALDPLQQGPSEWHQTAQAVLVDGAAEPPTTLQPLSDLRRRQEELPGFLC